MKANKIIAAVTGERIPARISPYYTVEEALHSTKNGCCPGRVVLITKSVFGAYSAQCACGGWMTTGARTAAEAAEEWHRMNGQSRRGRIRSLAAVKWPKGNEGRSEHGERLHGAGRDPAGHRSYSSAG